MLHLHRVVISSTRWYIKNSVISILIRQDFSVYIKSTLKIKGCCVVLCCVVLCCVALRCVALRCVVFCCVVLCCVVLCCIVLCCIVLCCVVLCCVALCCVVLCCVVLCCVVLCCVIFRPRNVGQWELVFLRVWRARKSHGEMHV